MRWAVASVKQTKSNPNTGFQCFNVYVFIEDIEGGNGALGATGSSLYCMDQLR